MQFLSVNEMHLLRCKNCNNFLSCGPMLVWREGTTLCGRCVTPKHKANPAYTFEQVIRTIRVPCRYWATHCKELLYPDEVRVHEQVCIYKNKCEMICGDLSAVFKMEKTLPHLKEPPKLLNISRQALEWLLCTKCNLYLSAPGCYINAQGRPFCYRCIPNTTPQPQMDYVRHNDLEQLLAFMVFPCIFHLRGCTKRFRFGDPSGHGHEQECPYGFAAQRPISQLTTKMVNGKQKGVIPTHTGHVFATITPNTIQLFANAGNWKDGQEKLMNNLHEKVGGKTTIDTDDQILDVSKLDGVNLRPRLDDVRTSFRENAPPPLVLNNPDDDSIVYRNKDHSPKRKDLMSPLTESLPISPVFVQQPSSGNPHYAPQYSHYNSLQRRDSELSMNSLVQVGKRTSFALPPLQEPPSDMQNSYRPNGDVPVQQQPHRSSLIHNNHQRSQNPRSHSLTNQRHSNGRPSTPPPMLLRLPSSPRMLLATDNADGPQSDEFQQYGLPYGNTNLTHGIQPNVYGKEVTVERVPSVLQYKNIVSELKIKQQIAEMGNDSD